ncbi:DNA polymerase III subunit gamma/tau [Paenibacillus sp. MBLB4367]|uniref:DNA polymerase III subunit gamma/tau n=1 Tax=Paenibacillus sp. MBLB4367 TaxID=3384767 RepID=UPI00390813B8
MAHIALYRSWRPQAFGDMVGQAHITRTLQNSLKEGRLTHAYLFCGPRGTGKTSAAKILAKAVNCERGPAEEPCNECSACRRITEGALVDVQEIDAASNRGVEEIRDIRDKVKYAPTEVRHKVYIIDEVHMLTTEAFNALLKTLEEPPAHVMFILATTEPHKLPATIISRCQRYDFRRVPLEEQVGRLAHVCREEGIETEKEALQYIARLSEGGMRDALSLMDQMISFSGRQITYDSVISMTGGISHDQFRQLAAMVKDGDVGQALGVVGGLMEEGKSADRCIESLLHYFRDMLMIKLMPGGQAVTDRIIDVEPFAQLGKGYANERIFGIIDTLNRYQVEMKYSAQPQTLLEVAVMKICTSPFSPAAEQGAAATAPSASNQDMELLKNRIAQLEQQLQRLIQTGAAPAAGSPAPRGQDAPRTQASPAIKRSTVKLDPYLAGKDSQDFKQVLMKWSQVLSQVKEMKISVHAWLVNGEPVSFHQDNVLLAFKSPLHRETTEKPANKQLIEQVMSGVFGQPTAFVTVMQKEWQDAESTPQQPAEEMRLEPEEPGVYKEEWINQAIHMFGEDLVKIKDQ